MTFVLGAALAAGMLLTVSPWMWLDGIRTSARDGSGRLSRLLEEAGFARFAPWQVVAVSLCAAGLAAAIAWLGTHLGALALVAAVAGGLAPVALLRARRMRLQKSRRGLWPDVCDLLIASVRAGMSLPDAVASLADCAPVELRPAFAAYRRDLAASGHFDSSARRLKSALADPVADRIIEILRMARQVGGTELGPVLRALAASVRADAALRAEVEARQSWIRGAAVLGVAAPWIVLALLVLRPEGARAYASAEGVILVVAGAGVSFVAYHVMLRIGRLPVARRWFG